MHFIENRRIRERQAARGHIPAEVKDDKFVLALVQPAARHKHGLRGANSPETSERTTVDPNMSFLPAAHEEIGICLFLACNLEALEPTRGLPFH